MKLAPPILLACATGAAFAAPAETLSARYPDVRWIDQAAIDTDLDGDGRRDHFAMGFGQDGRAVVAARLADGRFSRLEFDPSAMACTALFPDGCDKVEPLRMVLLDDGARHDLALMFELSTDALVATGHAHIVSIPAGETDPFWFYWDKQHNAMSWLRL